jgi:LemA protein
LEGSGDRSLGARARPAISQLRGTGKAGTLIGMGTALVILLVLVGAAGLAALFAIGQYNSLVTLRNRYKNSFAQIDVQLKRRYDLIPNLVETAKGYLKHERETLDAVISARNSAYSAGAKAAANPGNPQAMKELIGAEAGLSGALGRFFAVAEVYPDLKANQSMLQVSEELTSTENKISFVRQAYNDAVMAYNTRREVFPSNIIAGIFNFAAAEPFQIQRAAEKSVPKVSFT